MAVVDNKATAIGDSILIEAEAPIIGLIGLTDFIDTVTGEDGSRFFYKEFRYSINGGITFSNWVELTDTNLQEISVNVSDIFKVEYRYTRTGSSSQGELSFEDITLQGDIQDPSCGPVYEQSVFSKFFSCSDTQVLAWCINVTAKLYNKGIVPNFITRNQEDTTQDQDYLDFWTSVSCFFALFVYYARQYESFETNPDLMKEYLSQKGLYICECCTDLEDLVYLMGSFLDEVRKRGTYEIVKKKSDGRPVDGELLRLICYDENCDEFIFHNPKEQYVGWKLGFCSPLYMGNMGQEELIKAYELTRDVQDLDNYPLFNSAYVSLEEDDLGNTKSQKDVIGIDFDLAQIDEFVSISVSEDGAPAVDIQITYTGNPTSDLLSLKSAFNSSGLSITTVDWSNEGFKLTGDPGIRFEYYNKNLVIVAPLEFSKRDVIKLEGAPSGELSGIGPSNESGNLLESDSDKAIVVDNQLDYEISFLVKKNVDSNNLTFGVRSYDLNGNPVFLNSINTGNAQNYFFLRKTLPIVSEEDDYYLIRGIIYSTNTDVISDPNGYQLNIGYGEHLRFGGRICKIIPEVYIDNTQNGSGVSDAVYIHDFKVRILRTPYSVGFINTKNLTQIWLKNNNTSKTINQVEDIIRRFLVPYNSSLVINDIDNIQ